jgi:hypothetical protein
MRVVSSDPIGRLLFNALAMIAEFEADRVRMRTREGMKVARARGRLRGKTASRHVHGDRSELGLVPELADVSEMSRTYPTVWVRVHPVAMPFTVIAGSFRVVGQTPVLDAIEGDDHGRARRY